MSKRLNDQIISDELMQFESDEYIMTYILSIIELIVFTISSIIIIIYTKKKVLLKLNPFIFILIHCFTNLIELKINAKESFQFKSIFSYISNLIQIHLIISTFNKILEGKQIFKCDRDYSIKKLNIYEIITALTIFPFELIFQQTEFINFFQYLLMIILFLCFYEYVKKKFEQVLKYINECNKDIIEIVYMEAEELEKIYIIARYLWSISFIIILLFYIAKFFDILLRRIDIVHYKISLGLICIKETLIFILFLGTFFILFLLNKSYYKGQIMKEDDEEALKTKKGENNFEIEMDDVNIENKNLKNNYNIITKANSQANVIEIENFDNKNGNKDEEEKIDEEEENLNINDIKKEAELN